MKADELLISARDFHGRSRFPLADHGSMSDSAILHEVSPGEADALAQQSFYPPMCRFTARRIQQYTGSSRQT